MNILNDIKEIMELVNGYLVGGSVRDMLLKVKPSDYDIVTSLQPEEVISILSKRNIKTIDIGGQKFGTVVALYKDFKIEITTFRKEVYDYTNRSPEVQFTSSLKDVLSRRDFTINSIALDADMKLYDPFNGKTDIKHRILRFVGNPKDRIIEDPLIILRAFRFASSLGFRIDNEGSIFIELYVSELDRISKERIKEELIKSMATRYFFEYIMLNYNYHSFTYYGNTWGKVMEAMRFIVHDSRGHHYNETILEHSIDTIRYMDRNKFDYRLKLVGLLHDVGKTTTMSINEGKVHFLKHDEESVKIATKMMKELHFSNKSISYTIGIIKYHYSVKVIFEDNKMAISRFIAKLKMIRFDVDTFHDLLLFYFADIHSVINYSIIDYYTNLYSNIPYPKFDVELLERTKPTERRNIVYSKLVNTILDMV